MKGTIRGTSRYLTFSADIHNINHWVAGGEFVWDNQGKGWNTNCSATACDWKQVYDTGAGNSINTIADSGPVTYAGWCGNGCNPGGSAPFTSGLATNFGGTWHAITGKVLSIKMRLRRSRHHWRAHRMTNNSNGVVNHMLTPNQSGAIRKFVGPTSIGGTARFM